MKRFLFTLLLVTGLPGVFGKPSESQKASQAATHAAVDLFTAGKSADAVAHLQANLPPETGSDGATTALVQGLIEVTHNFYNQRKLNLAREAMTQAFAAADTIIRGRSPASAVRRASLLSSLGVLSEEVTLDWKTAESLYGAAATLDPANPSHAARKKAIVEKQKPRGKS